MSSQSAQALDQPSIVSETASSLSATEAEERIGLREAMRLRRSVDHFARAWYGSIASLILTGVAAKLFVDAAHSARPGPHWSPIAVVVLALGGWSFAAVYLLRSRRTARAERAMLERLQNLDERAPKPAELF